MTVHSTAEIHATADAFYAPLAARLDAILAEYDPDELQRVAALAERLRAAISSYAVEADPGVPPPRQG